MYQTDTNTRNALNDSVQRHYLRGKCGGITFNGNPDVLAGSFRINNQMCEATSVNIGGTYIGQMNLTFTTAFANTRGGWVGKTITAEIGIAVGDSITWIPAPGGEYTIRDATWTQDGLQVVAYDNVSKLDKKINTNSASGRAYDFLKEAARECGVALGMTELQVLALPNGNRLLGLYPTDSIITWRDLLSNLAQVLCCFVTTDRDGGIIFKKFPAKTDTVVNTIDINHRYTGASFSDFETFYTEIGITDIATNVTSFYSKGIGGSRMNLGANPFLQYGLASEKKEITDTILENIHSFSFVPFSGSTLMNPTYDLGDSVQFVGGISGTCKGAVMSYSIDLNTISLNGFGENPALSVVMSDAEKAASGASGSAAKQTLQYFTYTNISDQTIDIVRQRIATVTFVSTTESNMSIALEVDPDMTLSDDTAEIKFTYMLDGDELLYHPTHTIGENGKHIIDLTYYILNYEANQIGRFDVYMEVNGGTATLDAGDVHFILSGQGLVNNEDWDGNIEVEDEFSVTFDTNYDVAGFVETVETQLIEDLTESLNAGFNITFDTDYDVRFKGQAEVKGQSQMYIRVTEDGAERITEDGASLRLTEYGDETWAESEDD